MSSSTEIQHYTYYQTHWDREWYQPFREYQVRLAETVDTVLERLETGTFPCFTLDGQTVLLEDYLELRPQNRQRILDLIQAGKLSIGPWYVSPDEFLVSGESLIRNLQLGICLSKEWGYHQFTGYLPDNFGHASDIPMILKQFGIHTAMVWRGAAPPYAEFLWESRDGSQVLAYQLTDGYFQNFLHDAEQANHRLTTTQKLVEKLTAHSQSKMILLPIGGDHLGPLSQTEHQWLCEALPGLQISTPERFMQQLQAATNGNPLETLQGELRDNRTTFILPGVFSARMYLKQANRRLEHLLTKEIEPLLAMGQLLHPNGLAGHYPEQELALAWRTLLKNHPHDSICGCSVDEVHHRNETRFEEVDALCRSLRRRSHHLLNICFAGSDQWIIFNHNDIAYTGVVPTVEYTQDPTSKSGLTQIEETKEVLKDEYLYNLSEVPLSDRVMTERTGWIWAEEIPPHGFKVLSLDPTIYPKSLQANERLLENERLKVQWDTAGLLTILDKRTQRQYTHLHQLTARADQGDSYNHAPVPGTQTEQARLISCELIHPGPLVGCVALTYELSGMQFQTRISLSAGSDRLEFETRFTNRRENYRLQVGFPTGYPITEVQAEGYFGMDNRFYNPTYQLEKAMPVPPQKELPTNTGPIQRFISANGQSLITEGLAEYEVENERLLITLLRAFGYLSKGDTGVRGAQAGPPFPTPGGQCLDRAFICRYAWLPTPAEPHHLYQQALLFYGVLQGFQGRGSTPSSESKSLINWDNPQIVVSAIQWLPEQGLQLRLINTSGDTQTTRFNAGFTYQELTEVNFLSEPQDQLADSDVTLAPYQVKTFCFRVE